ncbi:energy transducer TonB [Flavobacterium hauense]
MSKVSVFEHGWIDLVFEGRNQEYGAYQLRKQDPKTTMLALFTGIGVMVLLVSIPMLINRFNPIAPIADGELELPTQTAIEIEAYKLPETPKPKPATEQPAAAAPQTNVATVEFRPMEATSEPVAPTVTSQDLVNALPASVTTEGNGTGPTLGPVGPATSGTGTSPSGTSTAPGGIETFVDVAPQYPGGLSEFYKEVARKFDTSDLQNVTTIKLLVYFVVEPDGTLSGIKAVRDPGQGMGTEAVRVLKSLKAKWKPGIKGGKAVRTAYNMPITIKVN